MYILWILCNCKFWKRLINSWILFYILRGICNCKFVCCDTIQVCNTIVHFVSLLWKIWKYRPRYGLCDVGKLWHIYSDLNLVCMILEKYEKMGTNFNFAGNHPENKYFIKKIAYILHRALIPTDVKRVYFTSVPS